MENSQKKKKKKLNLVLPISIAIIVVLGLWIWNYVALVKLDDRGSFGDMFGSVNAIFSGLAFAGIIITIYIQSYELKLQRKELKLSRKEMELTRNEFNMQNGTMKLQQFENTLFQILNMFAENTVKLSYSNLANTYSSKEIFQVYYNNVDNNFRNKAEDILNVDYYSRGAHNSTITNQILVIEKDDVITILKEVNGYFHETLYTYFSILHTILKLIEKTELDDKFFYVAIVKSHLTVNELIIIFYHCLLLDNQDEFKILVQYFGLLDNLSDQSLVNDFLKTELNTNYK